MDKNQSPNTQASQGVGVNMEATTLVRLDYNNGAPLYYLYDGRILEEKDYDIISNERKRQYAIRKPISK